MSSKKLNGSAVPGGFATSAGSLISADKSAGLKSGAAEKFGQSHDELYDDLQFDRQLFIALNTEFGPFRVDACCDDLGANAHVAQLFFCPSCSFLQADVSAQTVWLHPPVSLSLIHI